MPKLQIPTQPINIENDQLCICLDIMCICVCVCVCVCVRVCVREKRWCDKVMSGLRALGVTDE